MSEASESASALTSFAAPLPGAKDVSRLTPNLESYYSTIDANTPPLDKRKSEDEEEEEEEDVKKEEGSTGSDVSDNEMYDDDDDDEKGEYRQGNVTLDFQSEGGSFKNPAGCRFERNWRSESEKMTGCSYV